MKPCYSTSYIWRLVCIAAVTFVCLSGGEVHADDATVLPKGYWRIYVDGAFSLPVTQRFNKDGHKEDLATDFNTNLGSRVFSDLALVEAAFGLAPGTGILGKTDVKFTRHINIISLIPAYGITDKLSVGINLPYWSQDLNVQTGLNTSNATLGINPGVPGGIAPLGFPGTSPATAEDIQNLLVSRGFKRVQNWSHSGIGDLEIGARYQYYKADNFRAAFTGGVRFPTGEFDDPDNLVDNVPGGGAYALLFRFQQDWLHQKPGLMKLLGAADLGEFLINTAFRYDLILPDKQSFRVCNVHSPICPTKDDSVKRDTGDIFEAEISPTFGLGEGFYLTGTYKYGHKWKDHHSGDKGFDYGALSVETDYNEHIYRGALNYTTMKLFTENKFPIPLIASVYYRERFAGNNNMFASRYIGFALNVFF